MSIPRTIENTREPDETVCKPDDEEVCVLCFSFGCILLDFRDFNAFRYRIWPLLKNNEEKVWIFIYIMVQLRMLKT